MPQESPREARPCSKPRDTSMCPVRGAAQRASCRRDVARAQAAPEPVASCRRRAVPRAAGCDCPSRPPRAGAGRRFGRAPARGRPLPPRPGRERRGCECSASGHGLEMQELADRALIGAGRTSSWVIPNWHFRQPAKCSNFPVCPGGAVCGTERLVFNCAAALRRKPQPGARDHQQGQAASTASCQPAVTPRSHAGAQSEKHAAARPPT
jgi:hypothetical protein